MPVLAGAEPTYQRIARRNNAVRWLRLGVPLLGALVLAGLMAQIYLASVTGRFGIEQITITPDAIAIEAPEYKGTLADGAHYRVSAETARASTERSDLIALSNAQLVLNRVDGVQLTIAAAQATLDTINQLVLVPGVAEVADSTGTTGTLIDSTFDWHSQVMTTRGRVELDYADGTSVRAAGLVYDAARIVWTFERSVVTLPATPGDEEPAATGDETE